MKKIAFYLMLLMALLFLQLHADAPQAVEKEIKSIIIQVSPSLVKVVAENSRRYIATGIVIEPEYILSSYLIAKYPYKRIYVETTKKENISATIVGKDSESGISLLHLENRSLPPIRIAAGSNVGEWVVLVGAFYNQFPSVFKGIVSTSTNDELILNAPVAPGAAGGAVVNPNGELLGVIRGKFGFSFLPNYTFKDHSSEIIVTSSHSGESDLCYAVPSQKIKDLYISLKKFGRIPHPWLGISLDGESMKITEISDSSPAQRAGLRMGDTILEIDGRPFTQPEDVSRFIRSMQPGKKATIKIKREGKSFTLTAEIGESPEPARLEEEYATFFPPIEMLPLEKPVPALPLLKNYIINFSGSRQLGIDVYELTPELAQKYGIKEGHGLLVSRIGKESAAEKGGLKVGDIIIRFGPAEVNHLSDLRTAMESLKDKQAIPIEFYRDSLLKKLLIVPDQRKSFFSEMDNFKEQLAKLEKYRQIDLERNVRGKKEKIDRQLSEAEKRKQEILVIQQVKFKDELKKAQEENRRLLEEMKKKYEAELKRLKEEIEQLKKKKDI